MPTGTLSGEGKALFEKVYQKALSGSCKGDKSCAAATAWSAVKGAGWRKNKEGTWVKDSTVAFSTFAIIKASFDKATQEYRWRMVASDTGQDLYKESMSQELYKDFVDRIASNASIPEPFKSVICRGNGWCGGIPYLSISHYPDAEGKLVPGKVEDIYMDGDRLKARGVLYDTPLGQAVWKSLNKDLYGQSEYDDKIRVSIGFLDLEHKHVADAGGQDFTFTRSTLDQICPLCEEGIGNKIYMKGQLVHLALTRVPVNPRTEMEVEKAMADGEILTKKDDARSIVGDDLADMFSEMEGKSIIVIKAADGSTAEFSPDDFKRTVGETPKPDEHKYEKCYDPNTDSYDQECMDSMMMGQEDVAEYHMEQVRSGVVAKAVTKSESWGDEPSSSYLVVGDPKSPTTWHLPVKKHGKLDRGLMGAAHAALVGGGHRGNEYGGPDKSKAISKLRSLYKSQGMDWESKSFAEESMAEELEVRAKAVDKETAAEDAQETADEEQAENEKESKGKGKKDTMAKSRLDQAFDVLRAKVLRAQAEGITPDVATEIESAFADLGQAVQTEAVPQKAVDMSNIAEVIKAAVDGALNTKFEEFERRMAVQLAQVKAPVTRQDNSIRSVARRSLQLPVTKDNVLLQNRAKSDKTMDGKPMTQIQRLARKSTGLDTE